MNTRQASEQLPAREHGPAAYLNWLAMLQQKPLIHSQEYPLYTDAHIVAEVQHGPYHFLNAVPISGGFVRAAVVLRFDWHWEFPYPDWLKTDAHRYHGGSPAEEIAALASLGLGVRFKAGGSIREFVPNGDPKVLSP